MWAVRKETLDTIWIVCYKLTAIWAHVCERVCVYVRERERERERERVRVFEIFDTNALKMDLPLLKRAMALYQ